MEIYRLFNFGPTRIVMGYNGKSFTFTHNMSWETQDRAAAEYIAAHYPKIDIVEVRKMELDKGDSGSDNEGSSDGNGDVDSDTLSMSQLRKLAKSKGIKVPRTVTKQELLDLVKEN
ncbi:MAG: hypothetical protein JRI67_11570 [Deltaproteobacteria bacterium]|nr:hypothetical protein [Deltaproteobacteria bacterium]